MSGYDAVALSFDDYRKLPDEAALAIRQAVLAAAAHRPRLLEIGARTGRIGRPFVTAGDNYIGIDLSSAMLQVFGRQDRGDRPKARLVQADGARLPFPNATFDAVLLTQIFGGMDGWKDLIAEACRVLRPEGIVILGRTIMPADGVDARMKQHLAIELRKMGALSGAGSVRDDVQHWLGSNAKRNTLVLAASWQIERSAREFIERHRLGARFSALSKPSKEEALCRLEHCAVSTFGSLDAVSIERHEFELRIYRFQDRISG
jgi:SAM-dependent methyltransferase